MTDQENVAVSDLLSVLFRRRWLIASIITPIFAVGLSMALALPDKYESEARFRLSAGAVADAGPEQVELLDQYVYGLTEKVLSSDNLAALASIVDPFPGANIEPIEKVTSLKRAIRVEMITQSVLDSGGGRERNINTGFMVNVQNRDPVIASELALLLADSFIQTSRQERLALADSRQQFFIGEERRLSGWIASLEKQLANYKSENFDRLPETVQANVMIRSRLEQELDNIDREIRTAQQNRVFVEQQLRNAQSTVTTNNLAQLESEYAKKAATYADTHPDVIALRRQIELVRAGGGIAEPTSLSAQLIAQRSALAEARQRYSDDHPDIRRITRDIESLEARINSGIDDVPAPMAESVVAVQLRTQLRALDTQLSGLRQRAARLNQEIDVTSAQLQATPEVERGYSIIARELDTARAQYRQMIDERMSTEVTKAAVESGAADRFVIVARPSVADGASSPNRILIMVATFISALIIGVGIALLLELVDPRVRNSRDLLLLFGEGPLAVLPVVETFALRRKRVLRRVVFACVLLGSTLTGILTIRHFYN